MCIFVGLQAIYEIGSNQKYICCFIRVTHAIKLCVLETEEFFELILNEDTQDIDATIIDDNNGV